MNYQSFLDVLGITQLMAENYLTYGLMLIGVGFILILCWQYVVAGMFVMSVLTVLSHHQKDEPIVVKPNVVQEIIVEKEVVKEKEYIDSCTELTHNKNMCVDNYQHAKDNGHELELIPVESRTISKDKAVSNVSTVNLLDVDNEEYKVRRAAALTKPNAVVLHDTLR